MANKKKKKQEQKKSLSTTSAKANTAPKKTNTTASRKTSNVESRINAQSTKNAADKKANANKRSIVKRTNPISNSSASRVSQANKILNENKNAIPKDVHDQLKRKVNQAASRNVGDWDGMKMVTQGGFSKKEQKTLKTKRENMGRKAIGDTDYNNKGEGTRGSAAKTKTKTSAKPKTHTATKTDAKKDASRRATAEKLYGDKRSESQKRLKDFNTKDVISRAANQTAEKSNKDYETAIAKYQKDPSQENMAAVQAAFQRASTDIAAARKASEEAENAQTHYQHYVKYGKGNIDLTDLPTKRNGKTTSYATGDTKLNTKLFGSGNAFLHFDEDTKEYVLVPNYRKVDGNWEQLNEKEAWDNYKQSGKHLGRFKSEKEAKAYAEELTTTQGQRLDDKYAQESARFNELKNAEANAKAAFRAADNAYDALKESGASKAELKRAKSELAKARTAYEKASDKKSAYKEEHEDLKANAGVVASTVGQGLTNASSRVYSTLAMFANAVDKDDDNFFSRMSAESKKAAQAQARTSRSMTGTSKAGQKAQEYATEAVAALPDMVLAYMTGGGSELASTTKTLTRAAFEGMNSVGKAEALLGTVARGATEFAKSPNFTSSFLQMAGSSYDAAREDGASEKQAFSQGVLNGLLGSMVEVGEVGGDGIFGGVQKIGAYKKLMAKGDAKAMNKFIKDSVIGEGMEEVAQGVVERLLQTTTYGANNPVFSTKDPNAIINPVTAAQEFAGGAVVGGVLGGGGAIVTGGIRAADNIRASQTGRTASDVAGDKQNVISSIMKTYGDNTKAFKMAKEMNDRINEQYAYTGDVDEAGNVTFNAESASNVNPESVISNKEIGQLVRQAALDSRYEANLRKNQNEAQKNMSEWAQRVAGNARKTGSDGEVKRVDAKDADHLDRLIDQLMEQNGAYKIRGEDTGISATQMKKALKKFDFNDTFLSMISQKLETDAIIPEGEEVTASTLEKAIRSRAKELHEIELDRAMEIADQNALQQADAEEMQESIADMTESIVAEADTIQEEGPEPGTSDIELLAQRGPEAAQDTRTAQERAEDAQILQEDVANLNEQAEAFEEAGNMEAAQALRDEAAAMQRAEENYGVEQIEVGGEAYTRDTWQEKLKEDKAAGKPYLKNVEYIDRKVSDALFDTVLKRSGYASATRRNSLNGGVGQAVQMEFKQGVPLNDTQIRYGNFIAAGLKPRGVGKVVFANNSYMQGGPAFYDEKTQTVYLNAEKLTTRSAIEFNINHEYFHFGSDSTARAAGKTLDSKEGDELTDVTIKAFQDVAKAMKADYPKLYEKYVENFDSTLQSRIDREIDFRVNALGEDPNEVVKFVEDRNRAAMRQEIAADWIGELGEQLEVLDRMAAAHPAVVNRLYQTTRRLRRRMTGMVIPNGDGTVTNIADKEFIKAVDKISDNVIKALNKNADLQDDSITENAGKASIGSMLKAQRRLALSNDEWNRTTEGERIDLRRARKDLREARDTGDPVAIAEAQERLTALEGNIRNDLATARAWDTEQKKPEYTKPVPVEQQDKQFAEQVDAVLDITKGYGKLALSNYLYRYSTPAFLKNFGIMTNAPLSMPVSAVISSATDTQIGTRHSRAHNLGRDAIAEMPERIQTACFVTNTLSSFDNPGRSKDGRPTVVIFSPKIDQNTGRMVAYVMVPSVAGSATFSGVQGNPSNVVISAYPVANALGEMTQYDQQIDNRIAEVLSDSTKSVEQRNKIASELEQYKSENLYPDLFKESDVASERGTLFLDVKETSDKGKKRRAPNETGYIAEAVRRFESLYTHEERLRDVVDQMNEYRQKVWWPKAAQEARDKGVTPPPYPQDVRPPETLLFNSYLPRTGVHKHRTNFPMENNAQYDHQNGLFAGYSKVYAGENGGTYTGANPPSRRWSIPEDIKGREFVASHRIPGRYLALALRDNKLFAPSVAVTTPEIGMAQSSMYGNYVVMLKRKAVDPEADETTELFGADSWSPMMYMLSRDTDYMFSDEDQNRMRNDIVSKANDYYGENVFSEDDDSLLEIIANAGRGEDYNYRLWENSRVALSPEAFAREALNEGAATNLLMAAYLNDMGYTSATSRSDDLADMLDEAESTASADRPTFWEWIQDEYASHLTAAGLRVDDGLGGTYEMEGGDPLESFWASHIDLSDENKIERLFSEGSIGRLARSGNLTLGTVQSLVLDQYESIEDAREDRDVLEMMDDEEFKELEAEADDLIDTILESIHDDMQFMDTNEDFTDEEEDYENAITEPQQVLVGVLRNSDLSPEGIIETARDMGVDLDIETVYGIQQLVEMAQDTPTPYFEAKAKRVMSFTDNVASVVVPPNPDPAIINRLDEMGIPWTQAEGTSNEDYQDAIQSLDGVRFSLATDGSVHGFYSELQNVINDSKQNKMRPSQWLQYAKGHGQVKQEEIDYSGILGLPDESITKEDLLDYLRANQIELEEETLTPFDDNPEEYSYVDPETDELLSFSDIEDRIENEEIPYYIIDRYKLRGRDAVDVDYRLDFGDYRYNGSARLKVVAEFSDHGYPREITVGRFEISELDETLNNKAFDYSHWDQYTTPGGSNYREILLKIPGSEYTNSAMEYHWGESFEIEGRTGIISHARVNDFTNEKGDKVLFVEEIQSDWHNQGQKKGYYDKAENNTEVNVFNDNLPAPDAPFKDSYVSLTLKRLLTEAVEKGYDRLAWTTAQMQADRWLPKYMEGYRIEYDQQIPKFLNKYVKKWGSKVEMMEMLGENTGDEVIPIRAAYKVPSIKITDAMRESILTKGQPRFSLADANQEAEYRRRISELEDRIHTLERQQGGDLSSRAREATGAELAEVQTTRDAVQYAHDVEAIERTEQTGDIFNIPNPRTSSIEDVVGAVLNAGETGESTGELVNRIYRSMGYRADAPVAPRRTGQSRVNTNTLRKTKMMDNVIRTMEDENARIKAMSAESRVRQEGEYDIVSEQQSMAQAAARLDEDFDGERRKMESGSAEISGTDLDVFMGILSVDLKSGDTEKFMNTARIIQERATSAGQFIQAFAKYSRTPEGVLVEALNDLDKAKLKPAKKQELMEAMQDLAQTLEAMREGDMDGIIEVIKRQAKIRKTRISKFTLTSLKNSNWTTNYDRAMAQLRMIPRDYIPSSIGEKLSTYQVISHLLNMRTGMRNFVANTVFNDIDSMFANNFAWAADGVMSIFTGRRTVGRQMGGVIGKGKMAGAMQGLREEAANVALDIDPYSTATKYGNSKRTWHMTGGLASKGMSTLEKMLGYELNVSDEFQKGYIHAQVMNSLQPLIERGYMTEAQAEEFAQQDMKYRTFQDETLIGSFLGQIHDYGNVIGWGKTDKTVGKTGKLKVHAFGLGDFVQKYTTVPGALMTRAFEFSPTGYLGALHNIAVLREAASDLETEKNKSHPNDKKIARMEADLVAAQRQTALAFGRATTGTGLIILFTFLSLSGLINEEDKGEKTADKNYETIRGIEGLTGTQLNVSGLLRMVHGEDIDEAAKLKSGDKLMDIAFLEPFNSLLSMGALVAGTQEAFDLRESLKGLPLNTAQGLWNGLTDLPTMQTLRSVQQTIQYHQEDSPIPLIGEIGLDVLSGSATGFIPSVVRQAAQAQDELYRETYSTTDPIQQMRDALLNSIPGKREDLPSKLTPLGQDKTGEDELIRKLNAFVNPGTLRTYQPTSLYDFLEQEAAGTDTKSFYPERNAPYKATKTVDGVETEFELTAGQRRDYQILRGQTYENLMTQAMDSQAYSSMSPEDKKEALSTIKSLSNYIALKDYLMNEQGWTEEQAIGTSSTYKSYEKTLQAVNVGFNPIDWTAYKQTAYAQEGQKNAKGQTIRGSKKKAVINYISGLNITDAQKSYLFDNCGVNMKGNPWG